MVVKVLDSWALLAFLQDEPSAGEVEKLLVGAAENKLRLLLGVINWGEIYYAIARAESEAAAERNMRELASLGIELIPVEKDLFLVREAAKLKAKHRMSYADCFAAALAKIRGAELVTGDREFRQVEHEIEIHWLK